jgi:hypothetical protein
MILRIVGRDGKIAAAVDEFGFGIAVLHHRLLAFQDCNGNVAADVSTLMANIFPRDSVMTPDECRRLADGLVKYDLVIPYESDGMNFFNFPNFLKHQVGIRVDREKPEHPPYKPEKSRKESGTNPARIRHESGHVPAEEKRREENNTLRNTQSMCLSESDDLADKHKWDEIYLQVQNDFNRLADLYPSIQKIRALSDERKKWVRAKWSKPGFDWPGIVEGIHASPFLRGEVASVGGRKQFALSFDFIFKRADAWLLILEGKYKDRSTGGDPFDVKL